MVAILCVSTMGCLAKPQPRLRVEREAFFATVRHVCLEKVVFELLPRDPDLAAREFENLLVGALAEVGIKAVGSATVDGAWRSVVEAQGGLYDPHTGRVAGDKLRAVRAAYRTHLAETHGCDALLHPAIVVVTAPFLPGQAAWDGVTHPMPSGYSGFMAALSLYVRIEDRAGEELYFGTGGIQPLSKLNVGFWSAEFAQQPQDDLLSFPKFNVDAVRASLAGLAPEDPGR